MRALRWLMFIPHLTHVLSLTGNLILICLVYSLLPLSNESHQMWFIGLEFLVGPGGVNITLTYEIQMFINSGTIN